MTTAPTLVALTVTPRRTAYWIPGRRSSVTASDMERPIGKTLKCQALSAQWGQARRCVPRNIERAWSTAAIPRVHCRQHIVVAEAQPARVPHAAWTHVFPPNHTVIRVAVADAWDGPRERRWTTPAGTRIALHQRRAYSREDTLILRDAMGVAQ
jgi:hypothetical protein